MLLIITFMNKIEIVSQLMHLNNQIRHKIILEMKELFLDDESLTPLQMEALMIIFEHDQIKMSELAKFLNLKNSGATQLINGLVNQNKVLRDEDSKDRRITLIKLTPYWEIKIKVLKQKHDQMLASMFDKLTHDELQNLLQITQKITLAI
jgi:MarR family transcriptional regulator, organic hydroperoxide resistance regulator